MSFLVDLVLEGILDSLQGGSTKPDKDKEEQLRALVINSLISNKKDLLDNVNTNLN